MGVPFVSVCVALAIGTLQSDRVGRAVAGISSIVIEVCPPSRDCVQNVVLILDTLVKVHGL